MSKCCTSWNRSGGWWHILGIVSAFLSCVGYHVWRQANMNKIGFLGPVELANITGTVNPTLFNLKDFLGLMLWLFTFPMAVVAEVQFMAQFHRQRAHLALLVRIVIQTISAVLYIAGGAGAVYLGAYDPLSCGIVFCVFVKPIKAIDDGFKATVLFLYLISCLCGLLFVSVLLAIDVVTYQRRLKFQASNRRRSSVHASPKQQMVKMKNKADVVTDGEDSQMTDRLTDHDASAYADDQDHSEYIFPFDFQYAGKQRKRCCAITALVTVLGLPLMVLLTTFIPNSFAGFTAAGIQAGAQSPLLPDPNNASLCYYGGPYLCAEYPEALMRSYNVKVGDKINLKLWVDVLIYYGYIYIIIVAGLLTHAFECLHRCMHKRIRWPLGRRRCCGSRFYSIGCHACSVGTIFMGLITLAMLVMTTVYWMQSHNFNSTWPNPRLSAAELLGRTSGQLCLLLMSMLLLPVSRTSIWSFVFGVPWEAAIGTHILLAYCMLATGLFHMVSFWVVFNEQGFFPHDILAAPMFFPSNGFTGYANADNYTVPMTAISFWLTLLCMGVLAQSCVRRLCFEVFYYAHHVFLILILAVMFHAASAWFFLLGSMLMWLADRILRFVRGAHEVVVVTMRPIGGDKPVVAGVTDDNARVTHIAFKVRNLGISCRYHARPEALLHTTGQYVFLNVPAISGLEWHPFSLSSAPNDDCNSLHIKDMGKGTFTNKLFKLASNVERQRSASPGKLVPPPTIAIDGPYGNPVEYWRYRQIVLIAGGIGITPVHSTFRGLFYRSKAGHLQGNTTQKIRMLWIVRKPEFLTMFQDTLLAVAQENGDEQVGAESANSSATNDSKECRFDFQLFATRADGGDGHISVQTRAFPESSPPLPPNLSQIQVSAATQKSTSSQISVIPTSSASENADMDDSEFGTVDSEYKINDDEATPEPDGTVVVGDDTQDARLPYRAGRPDLNEDLADLTDLCGRVLIFVCGPKALVGSASTFALKHGYDFHAETFEL